MWKHSRSIIIIHVVRSFGFDVICCASYTSHNFVPIELCKQSKRSSRKSNQLFSTMSYKDGTTFLFTSESVNEGHPGKFHWCELLFDCCFCQWQTGDFFGNNAMPRVRKQSNARVRKPCNIGNGSERPPRIWSRISLDLLLRRIQIKLSSWSMVNKIQIW